MKANVSTDKDSKGVDLIAEDYVWVFIELEKNGNDIQVVLSDPLANNYVHEEWEALDYLRANLDEDFISKEELGDVLTTKEN
jgi:hypothetical protein